MLASGSVVAFLILGLQDVLLPPERAPDPVGVQVEIPGAEPRPREPELRPPEPEPQPPAPDPVNVVLDDVAITALEPRFVAPTRRDQIGRIWAPVQINGQGPFRLVLDTGASHSAITAKVATMLGLPLESKRQAKLQGATGSVMVPLIPIESLEVGDLLILPKHLPIIPDALGGAEGVLGTDGMENKRIYIDFRRDQISIARSKNERAPSGFVIVPVKFLRGRLLVVDAWIGGIRTKAIIDTGGQYTLGNEALKLALADRSRRFQTEPDQVIGATLDVQEGNRGPLPSLVLGEVLVRNAAMTFADFKIFEYWKMTDEPAVLIGMDVLGLLDVLIIDYRRQELQLKLRRS